MVRRPPTNRGPVVEPSNRENQSDPQRVEDLRPQVGAIISHQEQPLSGKDLFRGQPPKLSPSPDPPIAIPLGSPLERPSMISIPLTFLLVALLILAIILFLGASPEREVTLR
jgi:hypothetical protein